MMQFREGIQVKTSAGDMVGRISRVVIDPRNMELTHLVVEKGFLLTKDKVVPIDWVASASEDQVILKPEAGKLDSLPEFEETHYATLNDPDQANERVPPVETPRPYFWYPPAGYGTPGYPLIYGYPMPVLKVERNVPSGTVPLQEGANVLDKSGEKVGDVERIFIDPDTQQVTHFLLSSGLLLKQHKLVPAQWIWKLEENEVRLAVNAGFLEKLPEYKED